MSEKQKKTQKSSLLREVAPKKKHGLTVPRIKYPHEDYLKLVDENSANRVNEFESASDLNTTIGTTGYTSTTSTTDKAIQTDIINTEIKTPNNFDVLNKPEEINTRSNTTIGITGTTRTTGTTSAENYIAELQPVSPMSNFTKTPNSVTNIIQARGLFRGKSKQIYDYLWAVSRGSIKPKRIVRKTHGEIKAGAGLGSRNTVLDGLRHLAQIGLIRIVSSVGVNEGNEYEIFTPEEIGITGTTGTTGISALTGLTGISQNLAIPVQPYSGTTGTFQNTENKDTSAEAKTFFKTEEKRTDDDSASANPAFSIMNEKLEGAVKKITGKDASKQEAEKWGNLAELLILQLEIAASRTGEISSVPAFLTEVLRRKILKPHEQLKPKQKSNLKKDTVGKSVNEETFEADEEGRQIIKPLDPKGREEALTMLLEFAGREEILEDFKKWFVEEDWKWLMEKLNKS